MMCKLVLVLIMVVIGFVTLLFLLRLGFELSVYCFSDLIIADFEIGFPCLCEFGSLLISSENTLFGKKFILIDSGVNGLE